MNQEPVDDYLDKLDEEEAALYDCSASRPHGIIGKSLSGSESSQQRIKDKNTTQEHR